MKRVLLLSLFLSFYSLHAQHYELKGNLLQIGITDKTIDTAKIVNEWDKYSNEFGSGGGFYSHVIETKKGKHYLYNYSSYDQYISGSSSTLINNTEQITLSSFYGWFDIITPYLNFQRKIFSTEDGYWLMGGEYGIDFLSNEGVVSDPIIDYEYLLHVVGLVDTSALIFVDDNYYLGDISESPTISKKNKVTFSDDYFHEKIFNLFENYYITKVEYDNFIKIFKLNDSTFVEQSSFDFDQIIEWDYRDNMLLLFVLRDGDFKFENRVLDKETLQWNLEIEVNLGKFNYDFFNFNSRFSKYTIFKNDSLYLYSTNSESYLNRWDISDLNSPTRALIDSSNIYLHVTSTLVSAEEEKEIPDKFQLRQNYPNPFNPVTNISFGLGKSGVVTIDIFDILGRKLETVLDKYHNEGNYKYIFDFSKYPSGVYFYQMSCSNYVETKKMTLIK